MLSNIQLSTEIGLHVIDCIGEDAYDPYHRTAREAEYLRTLCICALMCKDWLHRSRVNLYRSIFVDEPNRFHSLERTFDTKPSFRHLVRTVHVTLSPDTSYNEKPRPRVPFHQALLLLRKMPSCTRSISVYGDIPLDNITRRCLSFGYPHIQHLHRGILRGPINRVHHIINAFPSLRTFSYSEWQTQYGEVTSKYSITGNGPASRLPKKEVPKPGPRPGILFCSEEYGVYIARMLHRTLECMETTDKTDWAQDDAGLLDRSKFPLLHSLTLQLFRAPSILRSLQDMVKFLRWHRGLSTSIHTLTLLLDGLFHTSKGWIKLTKMRMNMASGTECSALYSEIDELFSNMQHNAEDTVATLTFKCSQRLPKSIVNPVTSALQAGFPKLHRRGSLKIDFTIGGREPTYYKGDVTISSDGKLVARTMKNRFDSSETMVVVFHSQTGATLCEIEADMALTFLPQQHGDKEEYILVVKKGSAVVWDHFRGVCIAELDGLSDINDDDLESWRVVRSIHASTNLLVFCETNRSLFVWDAHDFTRLYPPDMFDEEDPGVKYAHVKSICACVSADERWLLMNTSAYEISVWNTVTWASHAVSSHHKGHRANAAAFSEDRVSIVVVCHCGVVQRWDFCKGRLLSNTHLVDSAGNLAHTLNRDITQLSPNGRRVCWAKDATWGGPHGSVNMSDADTGALLWSKSPFDTTLMWYKWSPKRIFFSPDGQHVVFRNHFFEVASCLWRAVDGECIIGIDKYGRGDPWWKFSPNGRVLVVAPDDCPTEESENFYVTEL